MSFRKHLQATKQLSRYFFGSRGTFLGSISAFFGSGNPFFGSFFSSRNVFFGRLPPDRMDDSAVPYHDRRPRQSGLGTCRLNVLDAGTDMLNITHLIHRLRNQRIERHRIMIPEQPFDGLTRWKFTRIPDLDSIGKHPHLERSITRIIAMSHCVDNDLANRPRSSSSRRKKSSIASLPEMYSARTDDRRPELLAG